MPEIVNFPTAALVLVAGLIRLRKIRPATPTHAQRHMLIALFAIATALVCATPTVQEAIQSVVPLPYVARLATSGAAMVAAFSIVVMVACVISGSDHAAIIRRKRRLAIALLVTLVFMTLGLASSETRFESTVEPDLEYVLSQLAYWGFIGACTVRFILLMSRYLARHDVRPRMRWAMLLVVAGDVVCMVWLVINIAGVAVSYFNQQSLGNFAAVSYVLAAATAVLMAGGIAVPVAAAHSRRIIRQYRIACLLRAITPMWRELTTTVPTVLLRQHVLDDDPSITLYRRVIEVRDAELILMNYAPSGIDDLVASVHPRRRSHQVAVRSEAVALSVAIDRYRASAQPFAYSAATNYPSVKTDLLREAQWLVRVHRAMRTDKVVAHVRQFADALSESSES